MNNSDYLIKLANHCAGIGLYKEEDEIMNVLLDSVRIAQTEELDTEPESDIAYIEKEIENAVRRADIKLLSVNADPKTIKGFRKGKGYLTGVLYLAPYTLSGKNVCPCASPDCIEACLNTAGDVRRQQKKDESRLNKTQWFFGMPGAKPYNVTDEPTRNGFLNRLKREITSLSVIASAQGLKLAIRLNGTSDIGWHQILREFMNSMPQVEFYDYTKIYNQAIKSVQDPNFPIHMTFSRTEDNQDKVFSVLSKGGQVAVVFDKVPFTWHGFKVVNGDEHDLRFMNEEQNPNGEPIGIVVGLKAKGKAVQQARNDKEMGYGPEQKFVVRASEIDGFPYL